MASLAYTATDEYGNDVIVRLPDWTGQPLLATTATPPDGTLIADGSEVSRASYPELFAKIGTTYGAGDGATTFNLPDWRDEFPRFSGADRAVGTKQGDTIRRFMGHIESVGAHEGGVMRPSFSGGNIVGTNILYQGTSGRNGWGTAPSSGVPATNYAIDLDVARAVPTAEENRPRNVAFLPCIIYV